MPDRLLQLYDYSVPPELIAQKPVTPRDAARLLVYDRAKRSTSYSTFKNLIDFLPQRAVLVFNDTKVLPARLFVKKETGGHVGILYVATDKGLLKILANRKLQVGSRLTIDKKLFCTVTKSDGQFYYLKPSFPVSRLHTILEKYGHAPLPPYIKHPVGSKKAIQKQYQAIFAKKYGAIAAPTASLHFTLSLIRSLKRNGFDVRYITLHVGLGTFAPLTEWHMAHGKLHMERYSISSRTAKLLNKAKKEGRSIIAVGTTVVRTLETASRSGLSPSRSEPEALQSRTAGKKANPQGRLKKLKGETRLFIRPGYTFKFVDGIITNFHVPRSSLMMLVSAFCSREDILSLYKKAIRKKFRFFSFGDGMLIF